MKKVTVNIENIKWKADEQGRLPDLPNALIRHEFTLKDDEKIEDFLTDWLTDTFCCDNEGFDVTVVDTENSPFLEDVLENIEIEDMDALDWNDLENRIKQGMPGFEIELFDVEDYSGSLELGYAMGMSMNDYAKEGIKEVKTGQWCTTSEDTFVLVVAIKTNKTVK